MVKRDAKDIIKDLQKKQMNPLEVQYVLSVFKDGQNEMTEEEMQS